MAKVKIRADEIVYSDKLEGDWGNYGWQVRFDMDGGKYLGITQFVGNEVKDRVLLSPKQAIALLAFVRQ